MPDPQSGACDTCSGETDGTGTVVDNDADDDGVCDDANEVSRLHRLLTACNYDATSTTDTDNTLCVFTVDALRHLLGRDRRHRKRHRQ